MYSKSEWWSIIVVISKGMDINMNNNKNRMKDRPKSDPELRKIKPKDNADVGIANGYKKGLHNGGHEKMMEDEV